MQKATRMLSSLCDTKRLHEDPWFGTYAKFSKKLTFLAPWYAHARARKTNISYPLIYNFAYVLNEWSPDWNLVFVNPWKQSEISRELRTLCLKRNKTTYQLQVSATQFLNNKRPRIFFKTFFFWKAYQNPYVKLQPNNKEYVQRRRQQQLQTCNRGKLLTCIEL